MVKSLSTEQESKILPGQLLNIYRIGASETSVTIWRIFKFIHWYILQIFLQHSTTL